MRKNVPIKRTKFVVHSVEYFTGTKAVDLIWNSPWSVPYAESAEKKSKIQPLFQSREDILNYLDVMLHNKFFHRAKKVPITSRDLGRKVKKDVVTHTEVSSSVSKSTDTEVSLLWSLHRSTVLSIHLLAGQKEDMQSSSWNAFGATFRGQFRCVRLDLSADPISLLGGWNATGTRWYCVMHVSSMATDVTTRCLLYKYGSDLFSGPYYRIGLLSTCFIQFGLDLYVWPTPFLVIAEFDGRCWLCGVVHSRL